jgi:hypothetical protein
MDATTFLAWLGAITGTSALVWDVFKWKRSGANLRVAVMLDMTVDENGFFREEFAPPNPYMAVRIVNEGQASTILESLQIVIYENKKKKRDYEEKARVIIFGTHLGKLPHTLAPAHKWVGAILQTPELEYSIQNELVYLEVHHTFNRRPTIIRVKRYAALELFGTFLKKKMPMDDAWTETRIPVQEPRYRIEAKPMPKGDLWKVVVYDSFRSKELKFFGGGWTHAEHLTEAEATTLAKELQEKHTLRNPE